MRTEGIKYRNQMPSFQENKCTMKAWSTEDEMHHLQQTEHTVKALHIADKVSLSYQEESTGNKSETDQIPNFEEKERKEKAHLFKEERYTDKESNTEDKILHFVRNEHVVSESSTGIEIPRFKKYDCKMKKSTTSIKNKMNHLQENKCIVKESSLDKQLPHIEENESTVKEGNTGEQMVHPQENECTVKKLSTVDQMPHRQGNKFIVKESSLEKQLAHLGGYESTMKERNTGEQIIHSEESECTVKKLSTEDQIPHLRKNEHKVKKLRTGDKMRNLQGKKRVVKKSRIGKESSKPRDDQRKIPANVAQRSQLKKLSSGPSSSRRSCNSREIPCNDESDVQCVSFQTIDGNDEYNIKRSLMEDHVPYPKCKHTAKELKANNYGQLQENQERIPVNVSSQSQRSNSDLATAYLKNSCSNSREDVNDEDAKVRNLPSEYIKEEKEHNVNGSTVIHNTEKDGLNTRETNTELKISPSQENGVTTDSSDQMSHSQEDRKNLPGDTVQQPQDAKPGSAAPAPTASTREDVNDEDAKVWNLPCESIKEEKEHNVNEPIVIHNTEKDELNTRETNTELKISPSQENGGTTDSSGQMSHSQEDRKNLPGDTVQQPQEAKPGSVGPAPTAGTSTSVAIDVESKALVESENEKNATIVGVKPPGYKNEAKLQRGSALKQVIAAFIANLGTINTGLVFGFSAVAIPQLEEEDSVIKINDEQASWIASLSSVTTPIGCIVSGYLMDLIGRKRTLIITEIPLILGWILISTSSAVEMIYVGRLLVGLGSGMVGAPARVYTGEVTQPHLRGMLSALASVGVSLGVLIEYALGAVVTWQVLAGISAAIPMMALLLIMLMPETPNYLLSRGRTEEAKAALKKFRGETCNVDKEIDDLVCFAAKNNVVRLKGWKETLHAVLSPAALKPFAILFAYFGIYQFSGVNSVTFYAVQVFKESGTEMNKYLATVLLGVVRLLSTIVACISLRRCGRRPLTMISGIGCGLTMVGLGSYMYMREGWAAEGIEPVATWFPVACIFIFTIACTLGFLVVPWVMIGEVYPTQVRGIVGGMTTCSAHLFVFIVVKTFPLLQQAASSHGTFWIYGFISLFGTIFFYFCLPETKGRTLQEIEDYFSGRTKTIGGEPITTLTGHKPMILEPQKGAMLP